MPVTFKKDAASQTEKLKANSHLEMLILC